ncbi:hypothetical protein BDQ17DRAFT_1229141 [Cyathus striatus]|nr:hypothetical protein BDQ17DRAFT_1229141 [Cyathus striatus]
MASLSDPPPPSLVLDIPAAADPARARLQSKLSFRRRFSLSRLFHAHTNRGRSLQSEQPLSSENSPLPSTELSDIHLDASHLRSQHECKDHYEWAILYEHQRGMTIFSIPYYSHMSLLPHDPSPFTLPNASPRRSKQPALTLANYPLPDGTWRWVSRCWMIDMRSDGEVQHDGFQYNWLFRKHHWRAHVGPFSAGGWVRRRRWIRLMMKPAKTRLDEWDDAMFHEVSSSPGKDSNGRARHSIASSFPTSSTSIPVSEVKLCEVWTGQDAAADWQRCRRILKWCAQDSHRLELWKAWLGCHRLEDTRKSSQPRQNEKQSERDDTLLPFDPLNAETDTLDGLSPVPTNYMIPIFCSYGSEILHTFVYPESRVQFLKLLSLTGLLSEMNIDLHGDNEIDFWSYANELGHGVLEAPNIKSSIK